MLDENAIKSPTRPQVVFGLTFLHFDAYLAQVVVINVYSLTFRLSGVHELAANCATRKTMPQTRLLADITRSRICRFDNLVEWHV